MNNEIRKDLFLNHKKSALTAGIALLAMALAAGAAYGYLHAQLVVPEDAALTAENLSAGQAAFYSEVALWWVIFLLDVTVSLALYRFYGTIDSKLSSAAMVLRLLYSLALGAAVTVLGTAAGLGEQALVRIELFEKIWSLGLIVFGAHLFCLGLLALKKKSTPPVLAWLLIFSGICYAVLHTLYNAGDGPAALASAAEPVLAAPMALAEMLLALWLMAGVIRNARPEPKLSRES
jgi:hypothetical protein